MLCDNCKKREATVRYEENINGDKRKVNLCNTCSQKLGLFNTNFMDNMLMSFFDEPLSIGYEKVKEEKSQKCGYTFSDYANTGLLGCPECYSTFELNLEPILRKLHGKSYHIKEENIKVNKENMKNKEVKDNRKVSEVEKLKQELNIAISKEEYEKAAEIRDKIKDLKERGET